MRKFEAQCSYIYVLIKKMRKLVKKRKFSTDQSRFLSDVYSLSMRNRPTSIQTLILFGGFSRPPRAETPLKNSSLITVNTIESQSAKEKLLTVLQLKLALVILLLLLLPNLCRGGCSKKIILQIMISGKSDSNFCWCVTFVSIYLSTYSIVDAPIVSYWI